MRFIMDEGDWNMMAQRKGKLDTILIDTLFKYHIPLFTNFTLIDLKTYSLLNVNVYHGP